jgi:long-chain acyl-CoA synthetase
MPFEPRYRTLVDILDHSLKTHGPRELFGTKKGGRWVWTTYAEFGRMVERFRGGLASLGIERGDRVAIVSNNRVEWAVAAYACYGLGAPFVPMYEAQSPRDWEYIVRDCEAKALIMANAQILAKAKGLLDGAPSLKSFILIDGATNGDARVATYASVLSLAPPAPAVRPAPEDIATLLYTSGTTGNPKGVVLTNASIASNVSASQQIFPIRPTDRSLSILPWAHAFGQTAELHTLLSVGASMAISEGVDRILENLAEVKPTILACVPTIFNRLYVAVQQQLATKPKPVQKLVSRALAAKAKERAGERLPFQERAALWLVDKIVFKKVRARLGGRLAFAISGGAALSREVAEFIDAIGIVVFEGYGLTETSPVVAANCPGARRIGSVGRALPGVRIDIDTAAGERAAADGTPARVEGEVVVHGPNVMKGYFKHPDETAAVFTPDGGFRTGDMGYLDADGFLFITGRIKEQYKLENGKYVVPSLLEDRLKLSPYVANVMIYGDNKPYNVALVVANVPALRKWAEANHMTLPERMDELLKDAHVRALLTKEIESNETEFKGFERVRDFAIVPSEFTVESGMLTPKMSLKRHKVVEAYGPLIEQLYAKDLARGERGRAPRAPQP